MILELSVLNEIVCISLEWKGIEVVSTFRWAAIFGGG